MPTVVLRVSAASLDHVVLGDRPFDALDRFAARRRRLGLQELLMLTHPEV